MRLSLAFFSFTALITASSLHAQTTVFSDNFNRAALTTGAPTTYMIPVTAGDGGAQIVSSSFLRLTNDSDHAVANASGRVMVSGLTSSYAAPYNTTLGLNTGQVVEWSANMKYSGPSNGTQPGAFGLGSYATAIVLASDRSDFTASDAQGYAIALGSGGTIDPVRLIRFTNGLTGNLNITDIVTSNPSALATVNNFASVRVRFDAITSQWSLFVRDDGASAWGDPTTVTTQIGTATVDTTLTNISLANFGFLWSYGGTPADQTTDFDNYRVTVAPVTEPATILAVSGLSLCAIGCVRRCRKRVRQIFTAEVLPA